MTVLRKIERKSKEIRKTSLSNRPSKKQNHVYYFGSFCLDETERQLLHKGRTVRLAPKAFDVLLVLIQSEGALVTKDRLLKEVWPDVFVEEANLTVNIASLRKVLEESDSEKEWIETVPKQGYRFVASVSELTGEEVIEGPHLCKGNHGGDEIINSVAVLPFENNGCGLAGEYLSDGLMESITNSLSRLRDLRVMPRYIVYSCYRRHIDPRTIGHKLGVRSVLLGRILRFDDRLIVRTELVDVINGWQLWGEQYDTNTADVLIVQQELSAAITKRLRTTLLLHS